MSPWLQSYVPVDSIYGYPIFKWARVTRFTDWLPMNCSTEVLCVVWYIINVQNVCVSQLMLFVTSCHCNYVHIFSCAGLWPYRVWNKTYESIRLLTPITVTSLWVRWRLKSPASRLFARPFVQAQIKENMKALRHWLLWGEFTGDQWISRTKGQ